jgi:DNA replication and repair protein RecF
LKRVLSGLDPAVTQAHRVRELSIRGFRNLTKLDLELGPRLNVLSGDNGHGKTSVLEALYLLATSRSFRTERVSEVRQQGAAVTTVHGVFVEGDIEREQRAVLGEGHRAFAIDGKPAERLGSYAVRTPIVVFHPGDIELVSGAAALRRRLLDRISLFAEPASGDVRSSYKRAQRERQVVLSTRGIVAPELDVFEKLMAEHGVALRKARERAIDALSQALLSAFASLAAVELELGLRYLPGGSDDVEEFAHELHQRRESDRRRKSSDYGPGRDDLALTIDGRSARKHASQGQQRVLTLALKAAELSCIRDARGAEPLLLLDDVSSELDPSRVGAVYEFVRTRPSQVLVTTTRPDLFEMQGIPSSERRDFRLRAGALDDSRLE